jgi:hypothetical protein
MGSELIDGLLDVPQIGHFVHCRLRL